MPNACATQIYFYYYFYSSGYRVGEDRKKITLTGSSAVQARVHAGLDSADQEPGADRALGNLRCGQTELVAQPAAPNIPSPEVVTEV